METPIRSTESFIKNSEQYDFFQVLYILEKKDLLKNIKLISSSRLSFPAADIYNFSEKPKQLEMAWMGLYGVDSPLPHHFLWKASKEDDEGKILRAFLDIFNHRFYQLFYLALKKYQPAVNINSYLKYLSTISDARVKSRVGLKASLREYLKDIVVEIKAFIPEWRKVETDQKYVLGENTILGSKILDYSSKIKIQIGPMSFEKALILKNNKDFLNLIKSYCPAYLKYEICFLINIPKNTFCRLGDSNLVLGWMCWNGELQTSLMQIML